MGYWQGLWIGMLMGAVLGVVATVGAEVLVACIAYGVYRLLVRVGLVKSEPVDPKSNLLVKVS